MESTAEAACPWCGEPSSISFDPQCPDQQFHTDCEVCCRPFVVTLHIEDGEVTQVDVGTP